MSDYTPQQKAMAIVPKPFGLLSLFGSMYVMYDILKSKKGCPVRNRLLMGLSAIDALGSFSWGFLSSWPIPKDSGMYLAAGNEAT